MPSKKYKKQFQKYINHLYKTHDILQNLYDDIFNFVCDNDINKDCNVFEINKLDKDLSKIYKILYELKRFKFDSTKISLYKEPKSSNVMLLPVEDEDVFVYY